MFSCCVRINYSALFGYCITDHGAEEIRHGRDNNSAEKQRGDVQRLIQTADKTLSALVGRRTRAINRTLRGVEELTDTDTPFQASPEELGDNSPE